MFVRFVTVLRFNTPQGGPRGISINLMIDWGMVSTLTSAACKT